MLTKRHVPEEFHNKAVGRHVFKAHLEVIPLSDSGHACPVETCMPVHSLFLK